MGMSLTMQRRHGLSSSRNHVDSRSARQSRQGGQLTWASGLDRRVVPQSAIIDKKGTFVAQSAATGTQEVQDEALLAQFHRPSGEGQRHVVERRRRPRRQRKPLAKSSGTQEQLDAPRGTSTIKTTRQWHRAIFFCRVKRDHSHKNPLVCCAARHSTTARYIPAIAFRESPGRCVGRPTPVRTSDARCASGISCRA